MIQTEYLRDGALVRHYSDAGMMLLQNETGVKYSDPIDVMPCAYTYTETDEPIEAEEETDEDEANVTDYQNALTEFGVKI
jgi:hypothetical protein